jgi:NADPH:quinone reductase-like Zn-dependent oxidoreductase
MPERITQSFWITAPGAGEIRSHRLTDPTEDQVCVRALYSGISRGTESLVFRGEVPASQYEVMRAPFQDGEFPGPVKYGYASVGVVEVGPAWLEGSIIFCLYPHQTRYVVPTDSVLPIPTGVPPGRAVLAANMETAVNALWDLGPRIGDRIAVVGAGTIGCLIAWLLARIPGCAVTLVDVDSAKADIARALGVSLETPDRVSGHADHVVHASGTAAGLRCALALAGFESTVLELSWFGATPVSLPLGETFHSRRLVLQSSQVGQVARAQRVRWDRRRRLSLALELLSNPVLDHLVTGESRFVDLPETMARLAEAPAGCLCHRIRYAD